MSPEDLVGASEAIGGSPRESEAPRGYLRLTYVRTNGRTDRRTKITPFVLQDIVPFGSAAQKQQQQPFLPAFASAFAWSASFF